MRFRIEDNLIEVECFWRREQKIEILERLGEEEALHCVCFLFRYDTLQRRVACIGPTMFDEIFEHLPAHLLIVIGVELP